MDKISLVIPCYNEEESLPFLRKELEKLIKKMNYVEFEILFIDNSSDDDTLKILKKFNKENKIYRYISFSRNFGKDSSMHAGLKNSTGDYVAIMDADLQDPPELIIEMYDAIRKENYDCVAAYRKDRHGEPFLRSLYANCFYKIMHRLSKLNIVSGARDYRLMTRQMVDAILELDEVERFSKGLFSWVGFNTKWISYSNQKRIAGKTKLPTKSAISYAMRGITSFSTFPLILASFVGVFFCVCAIGYMIYEFVKHIINGSAIVPGYSSLICVILFGFGLTLLVLGIIGQYLSTIYMEIKKRPKYIIKEKSK